MELLKNIHWEIQTFNLGGKDIHFINLNFDQTCKDVIDFK
jgi:hypothetical protein